MVFKTDVPIECDEEGVIMRRATPLAVCVLGLVLSGCSASDDENPDGEPEHTSAETVETADPARFDTTDVAELLRAEPGRFDLHENQEEIVDALVEAVEDGVEGEELFHTLLDLGAADFRNYQAYVDTFETDFSQPGERPEGSEVEVTTGEPLLNVQVLFDSSGSMRGEVDGGAKIDLAKTAVEEFVAELPDEANVSLRVYGHAGSNQSEDKAESCSTTEDVYPLGPLDEEAFGEALDAFEPTGFTPIALAIEEAMEDLNRQALGAASVVYVVSDGEETCDGDPVAAAQKLAESDAEAVVNIIGFDVSDDEQQQLKDIAEAGNGQYFGADSGNELRQLLRTERQELRRAWAEWRDEIRTTIAEERDRDRAVAGDLREEGRTLANEERDRLQAIARALDERADIELRPLHSAIHSRGTDIRRHLYGEFTDIRREVWSEGTDMRRDIWQEGTEERRRITGEMTQRE